MVDLAIVIFALRAILSAARLRWGGGVGCAVAALAVWLFLVFTGLHGREAEQWGIDGGWMLLLLGPSAMGGLSADLPLATVIGRHAMLVRVVGASLALFGFVSGMRHAGRHSPISDESVHWNRGALAFLPVLLLTAGEVVVFIISSLGMD